MKTPNPDIDPFVEALRGDLPSAGDEARVRARLLAAGVLGVSGAVATASNAATSVGAGTSAFGASTSGSAASSLAASGASSATLAASGAATTLAASGGGAAAVAAKAGLLSKLLVMPIAAKLGVAATLAVAVAATSVPLVLDRSPRDAPASVPAAAPAASPARRAAEPPRTPERPVLPVVAPPAAPAQLAAPQVAASRAMAAKPDVTRVAPPGPGGASVAPARRTPSKLGRTEPARASTLDEEARLMERAMLALGAGERELARHLLEEHARRFPSGLLERDRERALARVRQSDPQREL